MCIRDSPGGSLPQQVLKQLFFQARLSLLGLGQGNGDREGLPLRSPLIGGLQGIHVKVHPHHMVGDLKGIRVHLGTDRLGMELSINLIKVGFLGRYLLGVKLPLHLRVPLLAATQLLLHRLLQRGKSSLPGRLPVQAHPGAALGHHQTVPLQTPGGSGHITVQILFHLVQQALQFCCFHTSGFHRPLFRCV